MNSLSKRIGVFGAFFLLFIASYLDNIRGALLPVLVDRLQMSYKEVSSLLIFGSLGSVISLIFLKQLLSRSSIRKVLLFLSGLGVLSCIYSFQVKTLSSLAFFGVIVGFTYSAYGALSSLLMIQTIEPIKRGSYLNLLHMIYGLSSFFAPLIAALFIYQKISWPWLFGGMIPFLILSPLFYLKSGTTESNDAVYPKMVFSWRKIFILFLFSVYVGGEVSTSMWMVTYLVEGLRLDYTFASYHLSLFFICMALSRLICFFLPERFEKGVLISVIFLSVLFFILGRTVTPIFFSLIGIVGPFYPILLGSVSREFPKEWGTLTLWILFSIFLTTGCLNHLIGHFTDHFGIQFSFWIPAFLLLVTSVSVMTDHYRLKRSRNKPHETL